MCAPLGQTSTTPGRTASSSTAARTGIAHRRASTLARWLEGDGPRCWATTIAAGNAVGSAAVSTRSESIPPADEATPITTNSGDRSAASSAGSVISSAYAVIQITTATTPHGSMGVRSRTIGAGNPVLEEQVAPGFRRVPERHAGTGEVPASLRPAGGPRERDGHRGAGGGAPVDPEA